jgi:hypothetical protein
MIPISSGPWLMDMHGWIWFEVTTKNYQAVAYAVRGLDDGYDNYSYKHLTLLNTHTGKVFAEYSGNEIRIIETDWINEGFKGKRPSMVVFSTPDLNVTVNEEIVIDFRRSNPTTARVGFIDFMAFQPDNAAIQYRGNVEKGSAFYEYLITGRIITFVKMIQRFLQKMWCKFGMSLWKPA